MEKHIECAPHTDEILLLAPDYEEQKDRLSQGALSLRIGANLYLQGLSSHSVETFEKARICYEQSLFFGNDQAAVNLGYIYAYGRLGTVNQQKAADCFYRGMKMGNPEGAMKYGDFLRSGAVLPRSEGDAFKLYDMGYDLAQSVDEDDWVAGLALRLATSYELGRGTDPDQLKALCFYLQSAQRFERTVEDGNSHYLGRLEEAKAGAARLKDKGAEVHEQPLPAGASFNWDGDLLDSFGTPLPAGFYRDAAGSIFIARSKFAHERSRVAFRRSVAASPRSLYVSLSGGLESAGSRDFIIDFQQTPSDSGHCIDGAEVRSWLQVEGEVGKADCLMEAAEARLLWNKICDLGIVFWNDEYVSFKPAETSFEWSLCVNGENGSFKSAGTSVGPNNLESLVSLLDSCLKIR